MVQIRRMEPPDIAGVTALLRELNLGPISGVEDRLSALLDSPTHCCLVAVDDEMLQGAALAVYNGFHVFLSHIAVEPDRQGRGIGRALHTALEAHARARGALGILTDASLTATGFYAAMGYRKAGAVLLARDLSPHA